MPVLTRFEGPVTLSMTGAVPAAARADLAALLGRLRDEAGLDLTLLPDGQATFVTVAFEAKAVLL